MDPISFARGIPAPECLPVEELADCSLAALARDGRAVLNYGPAAGYAPLREWLAVRHGVDPERIVLTNGSLQGFFFLAKLLADAGPVLVEAPTYDRPLKLLAGLGADVVPLALDDEGLDPEALERALAAGPRPAFLYTIPTFQNPTGRTLSVDRRRRLVELAGRHGLLVLEDDPYGLIRFEGEAAPTLFELAGGEGVVYSSSFSKTIAPGLRVGYLVLPPALAAEVETAARDSYITPALLPQATVSEFLHRGNLASSLERVRSLLHARRDAMLAALELKMPAGARWNRPEGGYFLWLELPAGVSTAVVAERAAGDVEFVPGTDFFSAGTGGESALRLAFSYASPAQIEAGVARLASAIRGTAVLGRAA